MADNFENQTPQYDPQAAQVQQAVTTAMNEQKKKKKKKSLIIVGVIIAIIVVIAIAAGGSSGDSKDTGTAESSSSSSVSAEKQDTVNGAIGDYVCTVKSATVCKNWEGKDSVKITYEFTNNSDEAQSFDIALSDELYQDGVGLESSFIDSDDDWGLDVKIKPGTTKEVSKVYILRDKETAIDVEISELISFSDDKLTYSVDLK